MAKKKVDWEDDPVDLAEDDWNEIAPGVDCFRLFDNEPVRRIITGRRNHKVGAFYSWKMSGHVAHESDGEERCAKTLDVHPAVNAFFGQPETLRISVEDESRPERYTPDFLVFFGDREVRIEYKRMIDIWPPEPTDNNDERGWLIWNKAKETRRHLRVARDAYRSAGLIWAPVTDVCLAKMADPKTVDEIVANGGRPLDPRLLKRLLDHLRATPDGSAPLKQCEEVIGETDFPRGDVLSRIQERRIWIDLRAPITPATIVHLVRN